MNNARPVTRWLERLVRMLGARCEWETQTTDSDGCWRTWSDGFASFQEAMNSLSDDRANAEKWNSHMSDDRVRWRVEMRIVWVRYYEPNAPALPPGKKGDQ